MRREPRVRVSCSVNPDDLAYVLVLVFGGVHGLSIVIVYLSYTPLMSAIEPSPWHPTSCKKARLHTVAAAQRWALYLHWASNGLCMYQQMHAKSYRNKSARPVFVVCTVTVCTVGEFRTGVVSRSSYTLVYRPGSTARPPFHVQGASSSDFPPMAPAPMGTMAKSWQKRNGKIESNSRTFCT